MSGSYCNDESRTLILQTIAWSFAALSAFTCNSVPINSLPETFPNSEKIFLVLFVEEVPL